MTVEGNIVDIINRQIYFGQITVEAGKITDVRALDNERTTAPYLMPGFVDAHVHIESSMLTPAHFARLAVVHGTVGTVSDPHEIGNVLGVQGVEYMLEDAVQSPFHFAFGAPSCVPATSFETAGATIDTDDIASLLARNDVYYLAEMMNYPGVIHKDEMVMQKLTIAREAGKPIDGHAPGLRGQEAAIYFSHGITTDHECYQTDEAAEKLKLGVKILIREGSAAKNFEALIPLAKTQWQNMMFCSDDKHPDELVLGHINLLVKRAIYNHGIGLFDALYMACIHPVLHYSMPVGLMRIGDNADFIKVKDLQNFEVLQTYLGGSLAAENGVSKLPLPNSAIVNHFYASSIEPDQLVLAIPPNCVQMKVIAAKGGQLITTALHMDILNQNTFFNADLERDVLKIVVYNRYASAQPAIALIHGFGLKHGAIASSVAHDSHNVIAVGTNDQDLAAAINEVVKHQGGVAACYGDHTEVLPLPVAGLMSNLDGYLVSEAYQRVDQMSKKQLGSSLDAPFMTLSFMALLVIPELKLSDKGLFDAQKFEFTRIWL